VFAIALCMLIIIIRRRRMNVLRYQWSVSGPDEMGRVERGVPSIIPDTSRVRSTCQHRCLVEDASNTRVM